MWIVFLVRKDELSADRWHSNEIRYAVMNQFYKRPFLGY